MEALKEFGWLGVFALWLMDKFFPRFWTFFTDKVFPTRAREREKAAQAQREAEASLLKAKIEREIKEEDHRRRIDERMADAIEKMTLSITVNNERLSQLINITAEHDRFTVASVGKMTETVLKLHARDTNPKINRKRAK